MNRTLSARLASLVVVPLLATLAACGGDDSSRPSSDDVADALREGTSLLGGTEVFGSMSEEAIGCIADAVVDSDLSDEAVTALVEGDTDFEPSGEDEASADALDGVFEECAES